MSNFESRVIESIERTVISMIKTKGKVNIDVIEKKFVDGCSKCHLNKTCKQCSIQEKFITILENY